MQCTQTKRLDLSHLLPKTPFSLQTLPSLFISHGAPTLAIEQSSTTNALGKTGQNLPKPRLIIIMSAHWQSHQLEINGNAAPATWHDFSGFPRELYQLDYPAKGEPEIAEALGHQLHVSGIAVSINRLRPFDHGVWAPLWHLYPKADIPIIQISLPVNFDSYACYQLGGLFAPLRQQQILIIGSGSITHNLQSLRFGDNQIEQEASQFKHWMIQQLRSNIPKALEWQQHEFAKLNHPTTEHLLPLFFAAGAGRQMNIIHESFAHYNLGMDIYRFD